MRSFSDHQRKITLLSSLEISIKSIDYIVAWHDAAKNYIVERIFMTQQSNI